MNSVSLNLQKKTKETRRYLQNINAECKYNMLLKVLSPMKHKSGHTEQIRRACVHFVGIKAVSTVWR